MTLPKAPRRSKWRRGYLLILGLIIEEFMDMPVQVSIRTWGSSEGDNLKAAREKQREQLRTLLLRSGLEYGHGGKVLHRGSGVLTRQLGDLIRDRTCRP